ncbi:MAG: ribbon-helix-helix protein, CopG family [Leptospirales bacterium]
MKGEKTKRLNVCLPNTDLDAVRKLAAASGKTAADIIRESVRAHLDQPTSRPPREIDTDKIREAVSEAVAMKGGGAGIPPETLRYLVQDLARTENLLRQLSRLLSEGKTGDRARDFEEHMERVRMAKQKSARILKNLKLEEIEDVDRLEITESTPEETAQMLKEMGIETGGKNERLSGIRQS